MTTKSKRGKQRNKPKAKSAKEFALQQSYRELVELVTLAQKQSSRSGPVDLSSAGQFLSQHPQLITYLQSVQEREQATLAAKGSPTGSFPQAQSTLAGWVGDRNTAVGIPNAGVLRTWADSNEWVRSAINARRQQVERADIVVTPLDERKPYNRSLLKSVQRLLDQPNELRDSWRSLIGPVIEDTLVLDRGVMSKNMTLARKPVSLYYEDGAMIKIFPQWSGDPDEPRYLYEEPGGSNKVTLRNDELIVIMANVASYRYGLSPVQVLRNTIIADIEASKSAAHLVSMKPPPQALQIPGASDTQIRNWIASYDQNIAGKKELFVFGGNQPAQHFPLVFNAKDMQWLEWQEYLARKICAIFQISPQQIGLTMDINKATAGVQQEIFEDTGLIPLFLLVEEYLNRELLADFAPQGLLELLNLRIMFPEVSEMARQLHMEQIIQLAQAAMPGLPSMTPNQLLMARGEEPVKGGNTFWVNTTTGPVPWLSYDNELGHDYGPIGTSGELGAQDPAGGIDEDENVPGDSDSQDDGGPVDNSPASSSSSDTGDASSTTTTEAPTAAKRFSRKDIRHTGAMVAFFPALADARALAIAGGEQVADLHITLAFLGDASDLSSDQQKALKETVKTYAALTPRPLSGRISGIGRLTNVPDGQPTPVYASVDIPGLPAWREGLMNALKRAGISINEQHGFTPHITLAYIDADEPMPVISAPELEMTFSQVSIALADNRSSYPFGSGDQQKRVQPFNPYRDTRRPGKRWTNRSYDLSTKAQQPHEDPGQQILESAIEQMFSQAAQRGLSAIGSS